ncbi:hypothetical protein CVT26_006670 [Gymnopilus dilepis]|uniref:Uncharacterized protein n=1 Tax=Gymnopilus dilepis TaxID=231916 RepID=A0A409Y2N0_9AGAR|nr:hypothetical protein CVT26_006670 [Gymnopilus dilepis]
MRVLRDAHMPTHVIAATQQDQNPSTTPVMLPIDRAMFEEAFPNEERIIIPPAQPGSTSPVPRYITSTNGRELVVALPVIQITVPHVRSLALLLLFGMGLETDFNLLSWSLLPVNVVEEFPNAAAMSLILSKYPDDKFSSIYRQCHGIWMNSLALGLEHPRMVQLLQTAFNIAAEARKIRHGSSRHA